MYIMKPVYRTLILRLSKNYKFITAGGDYKEGDIHLVGGSYSWQGRVEIYLYGEWGTISYPYTDREMHMLFANNLDMTLHVRLL